MPEVLEKMAVYGLHSLTSASEWTTRGRNERYAFALQEKVARICRQDVRAFCRWVLGLDLQPFHEEILEWVEKHNASVIIAPRGHGKTTLISVGWVLWKLGNNPDLRIKIVAQSLEKAENIVYEISENILRNPRFHRVFPHIRPSQRGLWSRHRIYVERSTIQKDPSVEATGILSSQTGSRCDILIADDCVDMRNAVLLPRLREHVKMAWNNTFMNLLVPDGKVVFVQTPYHTDDLLSDLMKNPGYKVLRFSVGKNFESLWPSRFSSERLKEIEQQIGRREFARAYLCVPVADDELLFPPALVESLFKKREIPPNLHYYVGVDLSTGVSRSKKRSYTAIVVVGFDGRRRWLVEATRGQWTAPDTLRKLVGINERYHPTAIIVESNQYQVSLAQWAKTSGYALPIKTHVTTAKKHDPTLGLPRLSLEFESGAWVVPYPRHDVSCKCGICQWYHEFVTYPLGATDDLVMATWFVSNYLEESSRDEAMFDQWEW